MVDLIRSPTLDRPKAEFSGFDQGDRLVMPPDFVSVPNLVARLSFEGMKPSAFLKIADEEAEPPPFSFCLRPHDPLSLPPLGEGD